MEKADKYPYQKIKEELKNSEYDRTFSHWTAEEDEALISRHTQLQLSNLEIAKHHRRTLGSIKARLKLHGYPDKSPGDFVDQFANYLRNGINPITGEILSEDSAWLHPKIVSDLDEYINHSKNRSPRNSKTPQDIGTELYQKERSVFQEIFNQIEKFLPKITERDAALLRYLYSDSDRKITLQETADQFQISRERVRQVRDKALKKLKMSIRRKNFLAFENTKQTMQVLTKRDALIYLNDVLDKLQNGRSESSDEITQILNERRISTSSKVGLAWTKQDEETLVFMWEEGKSLEEISDALGRLNGGIKSRLRKLGYFDEKEATLVRNTSPMLSPRMQSDAKITSETTEPNHCSIDRKYQKYFSYDQMQIIEEIFSANGGITFPEICKKLNYTSPQLQGILGNITLRWRGIDRNHDRLWRVKEGKYFPLLSVQKTK